MVLILIDFNAFISWFYSPKACQMKNNIASRKLVIGSLLELSPVGQFSIHVVVGLGRQNPLEKAVKPNSSTSGSF